MSITSLLPIFITVFLAELGDKTQLAALLFASDGKLNPWMVFVVASLALILSTALAVLLGSYAGKYLEAFPLKLIAGIGFMLIGAMAIREYFIA
jgi:putative Ca2+/H+ antiporter (TMEM165/GDT1 family)